VAGNAGFNRWRTHSAAAYSFRFLRGGHDELDRKHHIEKKAEGLQRGAEKEGTAGSWGASTQARTSSAPSLPTTFACCCALKVFRTRRLTAIIASSALLVFRSLIICFQITRAFKIYGMPARQPSKEQHAETHTQVLFIWMEKESTDS